MDIFRFGKPDRRDVNISEPGGARGLQTQLLEVLDRLDEMDREILVLRHFEQLTNRECANILQLSPTAASNRYIRALERLQAAWVTSLRSDTAR